MKFDCNCTYCKSNGYIWLLKNNIVWVEIPKNGSYNLKRYRLNFNSGPIDNEPHSLLSKIEKINLNVHKRAFTILRNPIDRFKSLISHYFIKGGRTDNGKHWLLNLKINNWNNSNILDIVFENWEHMGSISEPHHFNTQTSFIPSEFFQINHMIYNMDDLSIMFGLDKSVNSSGSSNIKVSNSNLEKIVNLYNDDIELYKKYFNLNL